MSALPQLPDGRSWWVVETAGVANDGARFREFDAVSGTSEDDAKANHSAGIAKLDRSLMASAIRRGKIKDEADWTPLSRTTAYLRVAEVTTEEEVVSIDPLLLDMLQEHEFFLDDFAEDTATLIGGSFFLEERGQ